MLANEEAHFEASSVVATSRTGTQTDMYAPSERSVTRKHFDKAVQEFKNLVASGNEGVGVVLARHVALATWRATPLSNDSSVRVDARYETEDGVELIITLVETPVHIQATVEVLRQLGNYADIVHSIVVPRPEGMELRRGASVITRQPDANLIPSFANEDPIRPRLIIEIEFQHRTPGQAYDNLQLYFQRIPELRYAAFIEIYRRRGPQHLGEFACFAVALRRGAHDHGVLHDIVSFGSAELTAATIQALNRPQQYDLRRLPLAPHNLQAANPWPGAFNPFIEFPGIDLVQGALDPLTQAQANQQQPNLHLDLWVLFSRINHLRRF